MKKTFKPQGRTSEELFRERLSNILKQLTQDQGKELLNSKPLDELTDEEVKHIHDRFIEIQYSKNPTLQGEDIRGVIIYPYKN